MNSEKHCNGTFVTKTEIGPLLIKWDQDQILKIGHAGNVKSSKHVPDFVKELVTKIQKHFAGDIQDFSTTPIKLDHFTDFQKKVYKACRKIKAGTTTTYGELAKIAQSPKAARAVGMCMRNNPYLFVIPCHRVVGHNKKLVGFNMPGGIKVKAKLLEIEAN